MMHSFGSDQRIKVNNGYLPVNCKTADSQAEIPGIIEANLPVFYVFVSCKKWIGK